MAMITRSEFGVVAINNEVLSRVVVEEMLSMRDMLIPCNRRGKPYRKSFFSTGDELLNSVEIKVHNKTDISVRVYFIAKFGESITQMSYDLFDRIEAEFELLCLDKPTVLTACIKGVMAKQVIERNLEVTRRND